MDVINFGSSMLSRMSREVVWNSLEEAQRLYWRVKVNVIMLFLKLGLFSKHLALFFIYLWSIFLSSATMGKCAL